MILENPYNLCVIVIAIGYRSTICLCNFLYIFIFPLKAARVTRILGPWPQLRGVNDATKAA
jgi:hypothetical protein